MKTLKDLIDDQRRYDEKKDDDVVPVSQIMFSNNGRVCWTDYSGIEKCQPLTDHALAQMCSKLGVPVMYMRTLPPELLAKNMNHWLYETGQGKNWLLRSYDNSIRAVLSPEYSTIYSSNILEAVNEVMHGMKYKLVRPFSGVDSIHAKMMIKTPSGYKEYGTGVYVGNDEVGAAAIRAWPLIQRHSCENSMIAPSGGVTVKHIYMSRDIIVQRVKSWVIDALTQAARLVHRTDAAKQHKLPDIDELIDGLCNAYGFTDDIRQKIREGTEGEDTMNGLVNGLSFAAQHAETQEASIKLEELAGVYLAQPSHTNEIMVDEE